ncbi:helicase SRCAP-like isoform X3 [Scylla paramamosain]|uniref:helicase SRCAP-like isoform X3 n=1 Tax=Scylla paramamosain TaxID=85552 RepID=UPI003082FBD7
MANVGVVGQTATVTQSFHQQQVMRQRSERIDLKTPEADLGDVEADFQSLVNEMAKDSGSVKSFSATNMKQETFSSSTVSKQSFSSSSSGSSHVISTKLNGGLGTQMLTQAPASPKTEVPQPSVPITVDTGMVTAVPAQVIPDEGQRGGGESEVVVEKPMRVRDRIKKIEKQLSTEEIPTGPPEVLVPRGRSGSVKNLAEQFNQPNESTPPMPSVNASAFKHSRSLSGSSPSLTGSCGGSTTNLSGEGVVTTEFKSVKEIVSSFSQQEESTVGKKVEGEFKSVKETASIFQDPIQPLTTPIRPPPAFLTDGEAPPAAEEVEVLEPVAVLPPATMTRSASAPAPAKAPAAAIAPPQFTPIPAPEAVPTVPPKPEAPAAGPSAPDSQPTLAPEPASIYEFTPSPKTAPTPTPSVPEPIAPVAEPAPVVPPREAKPTAPPPVPAKNTQEEKAAPPPAAAPKPAATQASPAPPAPKEQVSAEETAAAAVTLTKSSSVTASESERIFEEALAEITKYSETLSQTSTESRSTSAETVVQQPIQYSAQVKCEVRSRVNTPEVPVAHEQLHQQIYQEQHQQKQKQQQHEQQQQKQVKQPQKPQQQQTSTSQTSAAASQKKTEMKTTTTTTTSTFSSAVSQSKSSSAQIQSSKATIAKTAAKPPKFEPSEGPPKFSLLRSNSTGSMGSTKAVASGMKHAGSDKDLPKFSVKKVKDNLTTNARVWSPGRTEKDDSGPSRIDAPDLPSFKDQPQSVDAEGGQCQPQPRTQGLPKDHLRTLVLPPTAPLTGEHHGAVN